jgi:DNA-directed RNA polymerase subunit RPC12/RpoP
MPYCTRCGAALPKDANFCRNCGSHIIMSDKKPVEQHGGFFYRLSGWAKLERFQVDHEPEGKRFSCRTVKVGAVRYRKCATVCIGPPGLYMTVRISSGYQPILIPWHEIKKVQKLWEPRLGQCVLFSIGEPGIGSIRLSTQIFDSMRPYLDPGTIQIK